MTLNITQVSTRNYGYPANQFFRGDIASNEAGDVLIVDGESWWARNDGSWTRFQSTSPTSPPEGIRIGGSDGVTKGIFSNRQNGFMLFGDTTMRGRIRDEASISAYYAGGESYDEEILTGSFTKRPYPARYNNFGFPRVDLLGIGVSSNLYRVIFYTQNYNNTTLNLGTHNISGTVTTSGVRPSVTTLPDNQLAAPILIFASSSSFVRLYLVSAANLTSRHSDSPSLQGLRHTPTGAAVSTGAAAGYGHVRAVQVGNRVAVIFYQSAKESGRPSVGYIEFDPSTNLWTEWVDVDLSSYSFGTGDQTQTYFACDPVAHGGTARWAIRASNRLYLFEKVFNRPPIAPTLSRVPAEYLAAQSQPLRLDWVFNDPDPGDTQSAYMLRRTVGTEVRYRNEDASWASTDNNATVESADKSVTLAAGWGSSTDARHEYQLRTWDASSAVSPWSSASIVRPAPVPSAGPTITAPASNGTIVPGADTNVTWTFGSQVAYRLRVLGGNNTSPDTNQVFYDSGLITSTNRSATAPFPTNNVTRWIEVRCRYTGSVDSPVSNRRVQITWAPPVIPTLSSVTADAGRGSLAVRWNTGATSAAAPDAVSFDIYRSTTSSGANPIRVAIVEGSTNNSNLVWHDYTVASEIEYWYQVRAIAVDGRASFSAWVG